jgi:hypothetical protein
MYQNGFGIAQDYGEAVKWYRRSAEQELPAGQFNLGAAYQNGFGVEKDYVEAARWYRLSAEHGFAVAENNLGMMYHDGLGVKKDYAEAVKWFRRSAEHGYLHGQGWLGLCYENGQGVEKDLEQARLWYRKSAAQGSEASQQALERLGDNFTAVPLPARPTEAGFPPAHPAPQQTAETRMSAEAVANPPSASGDPSPPQERPRPQQAEPMAESGGRSETVSRPQARSGTVVWKGRVDGSLLVTVEDNHPSAGLLSGDALPTAAMIITPEDRSHSILVSQPGPSNHFRRLIFSATGHGDVVVRFKWTRP